MLPGLLACLFATVALAQPLIYNRGIINAASFMPSTLPAGAISQGSVFSIYGAGLGPATAVSSPTYPLPANLAGVTIVVIQGTTSVNAIPIYVSASFINAIMPSNAPLGKSTVRVRYSTGLSNAMTVTIASSAFGAYTANVTGIGPGIVQNIASATSFPINSPTLAAKPGQTVVLWGTGLGPVPDDTVSPPVGSLPTTVEVWLGGVPVTNIVYSGRTPCCAGTDQINFQVPSNAPFGCWVPVYVRTGGATVSNVVTMAITADGSSCFNTLSPTPPFVTAGNYASFLGIRASTHEDIGVVTTLDVLGDYASGIAYSVPPNGYPFHPLFSYPPSGTCTAYSVPGDVLRGDALPGAVPAGTPLSFGAGFSLSGAGGLRMLQNLLTTPYYYLGGSVTGNFYTNTQFLNPGNYTISAAGGSNIGMFSTSASMPQPITWTNRDSIVTVSRSQPLNVTWSSGSGTQVVVVGFSVDLPTNSTSVFGCLAPPGAASFTVPAVMMANFPATRANPLQSKSVIYLVNAPGSGAASMFTASGLTSGLAELHNATGKTVVFQ